MLLYGPILAVIMTSTYAAISNIAGIGMKIGMSHISSEFVIFMTHLK